MSQSRKLRVPLRVIFYREGESWIAHCLEFDLVGDGMTREDALDLLSDAIAMQAQASLECKNPANLVGIEQINENTKKNMKQKINGEKKEIIKDKSLNRKNIYIGILL